MQATLRTLLALLKRHGTATTATAAFLLSAYQFGRDWWTSHDLQVLVTATAIDPEKNPLHVVLLNRGTKPVLVLRSGLALHWTEVHDKARKMVCAINEFEQTAPDLIEPGTIRTFAFQNLSEQLKSVAQVQGPKHPERLSSPVILGLRLTYLNSNNRVVSKLVVLGTLSGSGNDSAGPGVNLSAEKAPVHAVVIEPNEQLYEILHHALPSFDRSHDVIDC